MARPSFNDLSAVTVPHQYSNLNLETTFEFESKRKAQNRVAQQQHRQSEKEGPKASKSKGSISSISSSAASTSPSRQNSPFQTTNEIPTYERAGRFSGDSRAGICNIFSDPATTSDVPGGLQPELPFWGDDTIAPFNDRSAWNFMPSSTASPSDTNWLASSFPVTEVSNRTWSEFINPEALDPMILETPSQQQDNSRNVLQIPATPTESEGPKKPKRRLRSDAFTETEGPEKSLPQAKPTEIRSNDSVTTSSHEEEMESILSSARKMGFRNFDELAAWYYTSPSPSSSVLKFSQKMSRQRHLAGLFESIYADSMQWPENESQGIRQAPRGAVEGILGDEMKNLGNQVEVTERQGAYPTPLPSPQTEDKEIDLKAGRNLIQERMPNTLSLLIEVLSSTTLMSQRDISDTVFESLAVLCKPQLKRR